MEEQIIQASIDVLLPVMESAQVLAGEYCKACNRKTVTGEDLKYTMRYAAMNITGKQTGTLFPEIYEQESDSDEECDFEVVDEDDEPFTRYSGDDQLMIDINRAHDMWNSWVPSSPAEQLLKSSIDKVHGV
jgi:hypothetical protein